MDRSFRRVLRLGLGKSISEPVYVVAEGPFQVFVACRLANDLLQPTAVVVTNEEIDRIPFPFGFGHQSTEPCEQDLRVRVGAVEQRNTGFDGNRAKISGTVG